MTSPPFNLLVLGFLCTFFFTGCSKKETMEVDNETQSVVDYAIADQEFMSLVPAVYQSALATKGTGSQNGPFIPSCDSLIFSGGDTSTFNPNTFYTLNTAINNCGNVLPDGKTRSGKLTVRLSGKIKTKDSQVIIKLVNYTAGDWSYSCDSLVLTTKESTGAYCTFNVRLINGSCKNADRTIKYRFNRTFTVYPNGDAIGESGVTYIYGEASGTNRQGTNFSTSVSEQDRLVKHKICRYIDRGILELTPEGFKPRTINFGEGVCDDEATFTVNENTVTFKLK